MSNMINREQIQNKLASQETFVLLEVLPARYYAAAHLPGAINISLDHLREAAPTLLPDKRAFIVVYCSNIQCQNSTIASHELEQMGYSNVYKYAGGKQDWIEAGLPVLATAEVVS